MATTRTALPDFYYFCFGGLEPFIAFIGLLGTLAEPVITHNYQAPWPIGVEPYKVLPKATFVTLVQLAHVCALVGLINAFVLYAVRKHLSRDPAMQEKILFSLLAPLLVGDVAHISISLWALGEERWDVANWTPMLWTTIGIGLALMIPRICWHLGVGRYVDMRDGPFKNSPPGSREAKQ